MRFHTVLSTLIGICFLVPVLPGQYRGTSSSHPCASVLEREFRVEFVLNLEHPELHEAKLLLGGGHVQECRDKIVEYFSRLKPGHNVEPWPSYKDALFRADELLQNRYILGRHEPQNLTSDLSWRENPTGLNNWCFLLLALDILRSVNDAYRLTGDARYIMKGKELISDFAEDNADPESLPSRYSWFDHSVAYRTIYLVDYWNQWMDIKDQDRAFVLLLLELLWRHALYLTADRFYSRETNHGMYSNIALLRLSLAFPEFYESEKWKELAVSRMELQARENYTGEGLHKEYSPSYHILTARLLNRFQEDCSADTNIVFSSEFDSKITRIMSNIPHLFHPDGMLSLIGDSRLSSAESMLASLAHENSCIKYIQTNGKHGEAPGEISKSFPEAQLFVMRSGWGHVRPYKEETCLIADFTPFGKAHQHYDFLSFEFSARGFRWVTDLGPFSYNQHDPRRQYVISGPAHNVMIPYVRKTDVVEELNASKSKTSGKTAMGAKFILARIEQIGMIERAENRIAEYKILLRDDVGEHEDKILILIALCYQEMESGTEKSKEYLMKVIKRGPKSEYYDVAKQVLSTLDTPTDKIDFEEEAYARAKKLEGHSIERIEIDAADIPDELETPAIPNRISDNAERSSGQTVKSDSYMARVANINQSPVVDHWISGQDFDYLEGHFLYNNFFTHSRAILFIKPHCFLIVDRAEVTNPCMIKQFFHMPPAVEVTAHANGYLLSVGDSMRCLLLCLSRPPNAESRVVKGMVEPEMQGWYAGYGRIFEEAPVVEYSFETEKGYHYFAHLFVPLGGGDINDYEIKMVNGDTWDMDKKEPLLLTIQEPHHSTSISFLPSQTFLAPPAPDDITGPNVQVIRKIK